MRFLIKFPTRGRPEKFKKVLENIRSTIGTVDYKIMVTIDEDDSTMNSEEINSLLSTVWFYRRGKRVNKIEAVNRDIIFAGFDWDVLVNVSDDMEFVRENWGTIIEKDIKEKFSGSLDCYLHYNDGHCGKRMCTMQIIGREYFLRTGTIYPPIYKTIYADAHSMYKAMLEGRYYYFDNSIYTHKHPANGYQNSDSLYDENNQGAGDDQMIYEHLRKYNFYVTHPETIPTDLLPFQQGTLS